MRDLIGKLLSYAIELLTTFWTESNRIILNIVLWLAYYFRGYESRIGAIFGGLLVILILILLSLLSGIGTSWKKFVDGEVMRQPGRAQSGSSWLRKFLGTLIVNSIFIYILALLAWHILLVLRHLPVYQP